MRHGFRPRVTPRRSYWHHNPNATLTVQDVFDFANNDTVIGLSCPSWKVTTRPVEPPKVCIKYTNVF
jgi:hypothetical protein